MSKISYTTIIATGLVVLGFYLIDQLNQWFAIPNLGYFSLLFFGTIAYLLVFGSQGYRQLFQKPVAFWKNFFKYLILTVLTSTVLSLAIVSITHLHKGNAVANSPLYFFFLIMPFALLGEELFSIYFYELFKRSVTPLVANLLVCVIFGLLHYWTYFNGSILLTIIQVILLQGSARFWFNQSYQNSQSILTSFAIHYCFDLINFLLPMIIHH